MDDLKWDHAVVICLKEIVYLEFTIHNTLWAQNEIQALMRTHTTNTEMKENNDNVAFPRNYWYSNLSTKAHYLDVVVVVPCFIMVVVLCSFIFAVDSNWENQQCGMKIFLKQLYNPCAPPPTTTTTTTTTTDLWFP